MDLLLSIYRQLLKDNKSVHRRDRTEIIRQILDIANDARNITKTKLMFKIFLTHDQLKEYLILLTERNLLSYDSLTKTYKTTENGLRLLRFYNELGDMMKEPQPKPR